MILVTIDFSHYLPAYLADAHDAYALEHLQALDLDASSQVEIDSPPLYRALIDLAHALHQEHLSLQAHTDSLRLMRNTTGLEGTSHLLMSSASGTATAVSTHFTLFYDPRFHVTSPEERWVQGYDQVVTTTIPFPFAFIKEHAVSTTTWIAIPFTRAQMHSTSTEWQLENDRQYAQSQQTLTTRQAIMWARTHLVDTSSLSTKSVR